MVIVLEFCQWKEVYPVVLLLIDKDPEVLFQLLVHSFCLSITLRMVSSGGSQMDSKHAVQFFGELSHKLWTSVRDNLTGESMVSPDMLNKEAGSSSCCNHSECGYEMSSLSDRIHDHHDSVMSSGFR